MMQLNPAHPVYFFKLKRQHDDAYLKDLWLGMREGRVFSDRQIRRTEEVSMVFMVLALMPRHDIIKLRQRRIDMFYEYMEKSSPRSVNGMPCFMSVRCLNVLDTRRLWEIRDKVEAALDSV